MKEIYLLDIITTEGKKEIRNTKKYKSRSELLKAYRQVTKMFNNIDYTHSKWKIYFSPKIILAPEEEQQMK